VTEPKLSVVIPVRNRAGQRADNCLRSLRWQDLSASDFEIVLSDFGSDPEQARALAEIAERYDARVVATRTGELWNRSRALNIGIQAARGRYVMCTDIDMMFRPNFLSTVVGRLDANDKRLVVSRCHDLPPSVPEQPWTVDDYDALEAKASYRPSHGTGACQATKRSFFFDVRGYDEKYVFWGFEDGDMLFRAQLVGLTPCWIHEQTSMLHQWHRNVARDKLHYKYINKLRFWITRFRIEKNPSGWGARR
jgi:glycosyltransferase involved in cell wall biosynthesis